MEEPWASSSSAFGLACSQPEQRLTLRKREVENPLKDWLTIVPILCQIDTYPIQSAPPFAKAASLIVAVQIVPDLKRYATALILGTEKRFHDVLTVGNRFRTRLYFMSVTQTRNLVQSLRRFLSKNNLSENLLSIKHFNYLSAFLVLPEARRPLPER